MIRSARPKRSLAAMEQKDDCRDVLGQDRSNAPRTFSVPLASVAASQSRKASRTITVSSRGLPPAGEPPPGVSDYSRNGPNIRPIEL
jgi:hypothetical protein